MVGLFLSCDQDSKGFLDLDDFSGLCADLNLDSHQLNELFNSLDVNCNGKIEKHEFVNGFQAVASCFTEQNANSSYETPHSPEYRTSTPNKGQPNPDLQWDNLVNSYGHVILALSRYVHKMEIINKIFLTTLREVRLRPLNPHHRINVQSPTMSFLIISQIFFSVYRRVGF